MRIVPLTLLAGATIMLFGCGGNRLESYNGTTPAMRFDQFFDGPVRGHGIVQDRGGTVIKRFDVDLFGRWQGDEGTLEEHFVYYDGKVIDRAWHLHKMDDTHFVARADDIVGQASGEAQGTAIRWNYVMTVPMDSGKTLDISFDDWMYQMHDGLIINRNTMSKYGVNVGSLSITMQKQPSGTPNAAEHLNK